MLGADAGQEEVGLPREPPSRCDGLAKNRGNFVKHGLDFADVEQVFIGQCVTFVDGVSIMERNGLSLWACSPVE